mgnify:FL=1
MTDFKDSNYFKIYADVWNLHKKYYKIRDSDNAERWEALVKDIHIMCHNHENELEFDFAKALAMVMLTEIEREYREARCSNKLTN